MQEADELTDAAERGVLLAVQSQTSAGIHALRSTAVTVNVLLISTNTFLCAQVLPTIGTHPPRARIAAALLPLILACLGTAITHLIRQHHTEAAAVVRRIDERLRLFEPDADIPGDSIYPDRWRHFGTPRWREREVGFLVPFQLGLGLLLAVLTLTR